MKIIVLYLLLSVGVSVENILNWICEELAAASTEKGSLAIIIISIHPFLQ